MGKSFRMPNSFGSVYKLSGNHRRPYAVSKTFGWDNNGKQIKKIIGYAPSKKEGLEILLEYNKNPLSNIEQLDLTFESAFCQWFNIIDKNEEMSKANKSVYKSTFKNHCQPLYNIKILEMKTLDVQRCIDICCKGYNTKKYIKLISSQVYKYCSIQLDMPLSKNFSEGLKIGKQVKSTMHVPYNDVEIKKLWENSSIPFVDSILISIYTGMRPSELLKIELSNVFLEERYMIGGIKTDAGIDRIIPIHEDIAPIIQILIKNNTKYLIELNQKKILYRYYSDCYKSVMISLDINHTPHDGRHTLATELDNVGANEVCIKLILGHKIDDITKGVYTHKKKEQLIETNKLNLQKYLLVVC